MDIASTIVAGVIGGSIVAVVNWLFRRADVKLARQEEHRQAYRNMLSYLLDLYGAVRLMKVNIGPKVDAVLNSLLERLAQHVDVQETKAEMATLKPMIWNRMLHAMAGQFLSTIPDFKDAVARLAPIDPSIAFHIRAHRQVMLIVDQLEHTVVSVQEKAEPLTPEVQQMLAMSFKPKMLEDVLDGLTDMIEEVGDHVEPRFLADARAFMSRTIDEAPELDAQDVAIVDLVYEMIVKQIDTMGGAEQVSS